MTGALRELARVRPPVQRDLDGRRHLPGLKGLDDVAECAGADGVADDRVVPTAAHEDDGGIDGLLDRSSGLDTVSPVVEEDVHQDDVGVQLLREVNRLLPARGVPRDVVTVRLERGAEVAADTGIVVDDHHARGRNHVSLSLSRP
jgi:hypothetical protein